MTHSLKWDGENIRMDKYWWSFIKLTFAVIVFAVLMGMLVGYLE